jgi:hypothetical protein
MVVIITINPMELVEHELMEIIRLVLYHSTRATTIQYEDDETIGMLPRTTTTTMVQRHHFRTLICQAATRYVAHALHWH